MSNDPEDVSYAPLSFGRFGTYALQTLAIAPGIPADAPPPVPALPNPVLSDRDRIEDLLANGELDAAADAIVLLLAADPTNPEAWLLQARLFERQERYDEALEASRRAILLWPDVTPAHELQLRLAQRNGDSALAVRALEALLAARPDDPALCSEMGARLSELGQFDRALPFLRLSAPVLLHENSTLWNYTIGLALTAGYRELLDAGPLLDRMAVGSSAPYTPYRQLAAAKLALRFDRQETVRAQQALEASSLWRDPQAVFAGIADAIAAREPFSLICLDQELSYFFCTTSLHAHLVLRPPEILALGSTQTGWFDTPLEATPPALLAGLAAQVREALDTASLVGLPDAETLRLDNLHFGLLAEMGRAVPRHAAQAFTSFRILQMLHDSMPFLRSLLQGQPFLGLVGPHPELARRLGRFCGVAETRTILISAGDPATDRLDPEQPLQDQVAQAMVALDVPFRGALFLVALRGPHGLAFCGRIKAMGGIAIDINAVAQSWASY